MSKRTPERVFVAGHRGMVGSALVRVAVCVVAFPVLPSRTFARAVTVPVEVAVSPPREANEPRRRSVAGLPPEVFEESLDLLYDHAGVGLTNRSVRAKACSSRVCGCRNTGKSRPTGSKPCASNACGVAPTTTQSRSLPCKPSKASRTAPPTR